VTDFEQENAQTLPADRLDEIEKSHEFVKKSTVVPD